MRVSSYCKFYILFVPQNCNYFFNSAKFFDLEYQIYGDVPAQLPEGIQTFYWQHPTKDLALRNNYRTDNKAVTGFNALGIRLRHAVCDEWINKQYKFDYVLKHLKEANFDPEFFEVPAIR